VSEPACGCGRAGIVNAAADVFALTAFAGAAEPSTTPSCTALRHAPSNASPPGSFVRQ
jgi:hypothetical protein